MGEETVDLGPQVVTLPAAADIVIDSFTGRLLGWVRQDSEVRRAKAGWRAFVWSVGRVSRAEIIAGSNGFRSRDEAIAAVMRRPMT